MAITRKKKEDIVAKVKDIIKNSKTIVFVRFHEVTSEEANDMRDKCFENGVNYFVAKKTLIKKAFTDEKLEMPELEGEVAIAYGEDMLSPAQIMGEMQKGLKDRISILGGIFNGEIVSQEKMQSIANIPPLKTLYAQFLMVIKSPIQGCASALNEVAKKKS